MSAFQILAPNKKKKKLMEMTHVRSSGSHSEIPHPDLKSIRFDIFISRCHTQ